MSDDLDLKHLLTAALAHHSAGRPDLAEAGYRAVLRHYPNEPDALNLLGVMFLERGELDQAIAMLTRAVAAEPGFPEALSNLSRARLLTGSPEAAADLARRAIAHYPELAEAWVNLGRCMIDLRRDLDAAGALRRAAALAPESADILVLLGNVEMRLNDHAAVVDTLTALLALDPDRVETMIFLGVALRTIGRLDEAATWHSKAATMDPANPTAHEALAVTARRRGDLPASIAAARRALELAPDRVETWLGLSANLAALGCFAEAEACCREALALNPESAEARRELTAIGRQSGDPAEIRRLLTILDSTAAPMRERIAAAVAAGTLLDRSGDYDAAFAAFVSANRLIRAIWIEAGHCFDGAELRRYVDWAISAFTPAEFAATEDWGNPSELPVFIVGMPRSGTSLVEQIAASHHAVFGAGERKDIHEIVKTLNAGGRHLPPTGWDRKAVRRAADVQIDRLRGLGGDAIRVIDKLPDNCQALGQIAVLFPRARIIVCRRDPRDVCVSCHFQHFAEGQAWSTDQADLAARAREIDWLLAHWLKVVPLPVLEVHYEDVVANLEAESRRLIDFLGLE